MSDAPYTTVISAAELAPHVGDARWVILDCRHDLLDPDAGRAAYDSGHIAGAQFANIDTDLSGAKTGADGVFRGRHPLPERADLVATLRGWGVGDDSQVVAYDAHGGMFAARLWWLLRWLGHRAVAVLDGGLPAWQAAGQPLVTAADEDGAGAASASASASAPAAAARGSFTERPALTRTVSLDDVVANLTAHGAAARVVIDARAADRYRGENETIDPVGGHIPGARNRFFKDNLGADGRFKDAAQLQAEWAPLLAGVAGMAGLAGANAVPQPAQQAIMQCGSGVTACHNLLALEVAGLPGAALYPGSWSEWCADPARPVATGA